AVLDSPVWLDVGQARSQDDVLCQLSVLGPLRIPDVLAARHPRSNDRDPDHRGRDQLWPDGDVRHRGAVVFRTVHRAAALYRRLARLPGRCGLERRAEPTDRSVTDDLGRRRHLAGLAVPDRLRADHRDRDVRGTGNGQQGTDLMLDTTQTSSGGAVMPGWTGVVRHLHVTPRAFLPMREMPEITLVEGKGIEGDRYMIGREAGFYSHKPEEGRQVTLFEFETLVALKRDAGIELGPEEHRPKFSAKRVRTALRGA